MRIWPGYHFHEFGEEALLALETTDDGLLRHAGTLRNLLERDVVEPPVAMSHSISASMMRLPVASAAAALAPL